MANAAKRQKNGYIFEKKSGDLLEQWPSGSREVYLSAPYLPKRLLRRKNVSAPLPLPFDILASYGIINAARTVHDTSYYCNYRNKAFVSVLITTQGVADVRINDKSYTLKRHSVFVSNAGVETRITVKKDWHVLWFHMSESWRFSGGSAAIVENADTAEILHCADVYLKEAFRPRRNLHLLDLCAQMLVLRLRELFATPADTPKKLVEILETIRMNPATEISAKTSAKRLAISVYELDKLSLAVCGYKFRKAVENIKMEHARAMLCKKTPVAEVAKTLGYADQAAFSKAFKRFHKIPPSRYFFGKVSTRPPQRLPRV